MNFVERIIAAFNQYIRQQTRNHSARRDIVKDRNVINRSQRRQNLRAFVLIHQRPALALQFPHRCVAVDGHEQHIAQRPRLFQIADMTDMQNVENAVSENQLLARGAQTLAFEQESIERKNLLRHFDRLIWYARIWRAAGRRPAYRLKQFRFADRLFFRLAYSDPIHGILQHARFDMAQGGNLARGAIGSFLNHVSGMALRPVPLNAVTRPCFIKTLPPIMIRFAAIRSFHRLDNVLRVRVHPHAARLFQSLQPQRRRGNLGLLIGCLAEIRSKRPPKPLVAKQSHRRRARRVATIAETRAVTVDSD